MLCKSVSTRRIFLARHGNRQDLVDPAWLDSAEEPYDPPLSTDGVEQARRLGQRLAPEGIDVIVASPFLRAVQTAHHANQALGAPIFLEPGIGEYLSAHSFTRPPRLQELAALRALYPTLEEGYAPVLALQYPESREQLRERARQVLTALLERFDGTVLVVGHAASVAAASLMDEQIKRVECPLCALFCLEHDGARWRLSINGEIAHVGARLASFTFP